MSTNAPDSAQERRAAFRLACEAAQLPVSTYVRGMPPGVRARNPIVMVGLERDAPPPPGFVPPPDMHGVVHGAKGVGVDLHLVYAADLDAALAALPLSEDLRAKVRWHAEQHGSIVAIGRLPYVRVILYDVAGGSCAFARVDDDTAAEAN